MTEDLYPSRQSKLPHLGQRKDPVVYSPWAEGSPITRKQYEAYKANGFLVLEDVLQPLEVNTLKDESEQLRDARLPIDPETIITEPDSGSIRSIFKVHAQNVIFERLAQDSRLVDIAEFILGDQIYIHQSRLNYKPGFDGKDFYWHSDFETWHVEDGLPRMRTLSMSILLTDNVTANSPTMFMPGSHQIYVSCVGETPDDHFKQSLKKQEYGVPDHNSLTHLAQAGINVPTGKAGSVVIFDCNIMHGSNSNITPFPRSNAFFVYNAVSNKPCAPFGPDKPRPHFIAERDNFTALKTTNGTIVVSAA